MYLNAALWHTGTSIERWGRALTGEEMRNILFVFGQLTDEDVTWLTEAGEPRKLRTGTELIAAGIPAQSVHVLLDGEARVTASGADRADVAQLRPGDIIGEMSFIDASPPSASVTTTTDSVTLEIPRLVLEHKLQHDSAFASRFFRALAMLLSDRLRKTMTRFTGSRQNDHEGTLALDELDPNVLEEVTRAGERFERMLKASLKR